MNILITGGAGFIGSHIAAYHAAKGDAIWVVDNLSEGRLENLEGLKLHRFDQYDIRNYPSLSEAVAWSDRIYHMAALLGQRRVLTYPVETLFNNIDGCQKILEAMSHLKKDIRLIIASSSGVYWHVTPGPDNTLHESDTIAVPSGQFREESYYLSKLINEVMALAYAHEKGCHCTIARIFNTIGPRQSRSYGMVVPTFVEQALTGQPITIYGDGQQTRSFCHVKDVARALSLLLENPSSRAEIYNVGYDQECSILELATMVKTLSKSPSEIHFISYKETYGFDFKDTNQRPPNMTKIKALTGFTPEYSLEETLKELIQTYAASPHSK